MRESIRKWKRSVCRASLTVEAAVAMGFFCLCMGCILLLFPFIEKEIVNTQVMYEVCEHAELLSAVEPGLVEEAVLVNSYVAWEARSKASGMVYYAEKEGEGTLYSGEFHMPVPFDILSKRLIFLQTMYIRHWTGYDRSEGLEKEMVYITKTGEVYHRTIQCSHLQVSIREVSFQDIDTYRNRSGGKYYPCEQCAKGSCGDKVYITTEGERYHCSRNCSSLLRFIQKVERLAVEDSHRPCKTCYGSSRGEEKYGQRNRGAVTSGVDCGSSG